METRRASALLCALFLPIFFNISCTDIAYLPSINLQLHTKGVIQTKYARLYSEAMHGLWIALDHENNSIIYKLTQGENNPHTIDINDITNKVKLYIDEHEEEIKDGLGEIINLQNAYDIVEFAKRYVAPIPSIKDISDELLYLTSRKQLYNYRKTHIEAGLYKFFIPDAFLKIRRTISVWQRKYDLSQDNTQEINHMISIAQNYIDNFPIPQNQDDLFKISLDVENSNPPYLDDQGKPHIRQFAEISTDIIKIVRPKDKKVQAADCETTLGVFLYMPSQKEFYGDRQNCERFVKRVERFDKLLKNRIRMIFKPNAAQGLKKHLNKIVSITIKEIKNQQEKISQKIDTICDELSSIFQ